MFEQFKINVKDGFYIGDLCYALDGNVYHSVWGANNYADGAYNYDGKEFAMVGTAYGDGCYRGSDRFKYPVDAGIIGICDKALVANNIEKLGKIIDYTGKVVITYDDGDIIVEYGNDRIVIPTN